LRLRIVAPVAGDEAFVMAGTDDGPAYWTSVRLLAQPDATGIATVQLPPGSQWTLASLSSSFESPTALALEPPEPLPCHGTALIDRFGEAASVLDAPPAVRLLFDGADHARRARAVRLHRSRTIALAFTLASIFVLIVMVFAATLRRGPTSLESVSGGRRQRLAIAIAMSFALLVGGWVLITAFALRVS
jgi:hypothetical protein